METPVFWGRPFFPRMSLMDMNFALEMSMSEERKPETPDFYFLRDRGKHIWRWVCVDICLEVAAFLWPLHSSVLPLHYEILSMFPLWTPESLAISAVGSHLGSRGSSARDELYLQLSPPWLWSPRSQPLLSSSLSAEVARAFLKQKDPVSHWPSLIGLQVTSGSCKVSAVLLWPGCL